jgi:hypothetical protein
MRQIGGSLGIAIMGAIVAASVPSAAGAKRPADFLNGFHHALETGAVITIAGAVVAAATLHHARHREPAREAFPEAA